MPRTRHKVCRGHPATVTHQCQCARCHGTGIEASPFDPEALLEAIVAQVDVDIFNTRDLMKIAKVQGSLLQIAIGNMTAKRLGKALRRISDLGILGGVSLGRLGKDKNGALWHIQFRR